MAHIVKRTTFEDVVAACPDTIWYSYRTCWWTHRAEDLRQLPPKVEGESGLPCDPRGGVLMMVSASALLDNAQANPELYGKHGLAAFMAAHNDNCVVSFRDMRNTCLETWQEYNDLLDFQIDLANTIEDIKKEKEGI